MATLIVNDQDKIELETTSEHSIFDLLITAQSEHWGEESMIQSLSVNGETIEPLEEETLMGIPAEGAEIRVALVQPEPRSIEETLADVVTYLNKLEAGFEDLAPRIRPNKDPEAFVSMGDGLDGLSSIVELIENLVQDAKVSDEVRTNFKTFAEDLREKSIEMMESQESGDATLIADILEYELVDAVKDLLEIVESLQESLV